MLHRGAVTCPACQDLAAYVTVRIARCRLGRGKPHCLHCQHPCFSPARRLQFSHVLRWSIPRFIWRHPLRALRYQLHPLSRIARGKPGQMAVRRSAR
ncbi:nitrous oxide-stimulated promoter family protein [Photobacterium atrarenae]|uniref:Nitrous oxide-stimulated promoter family protein n=2 Tax=Photobacterium atrarenae TaxID=865757 RepID=A0ABY5GJ22_9GAMM|nr:nitrous oxide-stimulated promoter family protein [Photobacterium atrarenae]